MNKAKLKEIKDSLVIPTESDPPIFKSIIKVFNDILEAILEENEVPEGKHIRRENHEQGEVCSDCV